jgi:proteasome lid subunit RPN8/RPN11
MIQLPPHFLTVASHWHQERNRYRNRVEVGGFLVANPVTPDTVAFATGPGKGAEHEYASVGLCRQDVEPAVEAAGYRVVGDWHSHPKNLRPSQTDVNTWAQQLKESTLERWHSVILLRGEQGWQDMVGWSTSWMDGAYRARKVEATPGLSAARELAKDLSWMVNRSSLLDQASWIKEPYRLHQDLCILDMNVDLLRRVKQQETNEKLKRLGMREMKLSPLPRREPVVPGVEVIYGGGMIRRPCGTVLGVR